jgi:hypothetical protein
MRSNETGETSGPPKNGDNFLARAIARQNDYIRARGFFQIELRRDARDKNRVNESQSNKRIDFLTSYTAHGHQLRFWNQVFTRFRA